MICSNIAPAANFHSRDEEEDDEEDVEEGDVLGHEAITRVEEDVDEFLHIKIAQPHDDATSISSSSCSYALWSEQGALL